MVQAIIILKRTVRNGAGKARLKNGDIVLLYFVGVIFWL